MLAPENSPTVHNQAWSDALVSFCPDPQEINSRFRYEHYHYRFRHLSDACVPPKLVPFSGSVLATSESPFPLLSIAYTG
jgi:hypothetical protein